MYAFQDALLNLTPKSNGQIIRSDSVSSDTKYLAQEFKVAY